MVAEIEADTLFDWDKLELEDPVTDPLFDWELDALDTVAEADPLFDWD